MTGFQYKPGIVTALPRRRYKFGEYTVVVLGDIESNDGIDYRYIVAVVRGADPEPGFYLTAERDMVGGGAGEDYSMRVIMQDGADIIGTSREWRDLDAFVREALDVIGKVFKLTDEVPYPLA